MANQLYFSRDTKVYIKLGSDIWEIPVLDGFSFAQSTNASEIVLAEMESAAGVSRRGKRKFNDSLAPAEWSFTTYTRPFMSAGGAGTSAAVPDADAASRTHAVEEVLWGMMAGKAFYEAYGFKTATGGTSYTTWSTTTATDDTLTFDFDTSNVSTLRDDVEIIFKLGDAQQKYYSITGAVVNEATIDFDIDGIASINWSGMGSELTETTIPTATITEGITATNNFIRNRLTSLTIAPNSGAYTSAEFALLEASYDMTLTGGSIAISNNITYITPEELGLVNVPIGHVTGNRSVSGSFTCYLDKSDVDTDVSANFWTDMAALKAKVTHSFAITFSIGGAAGVPRVIFTMPQATIEIPTHSIEDIISLETTFDGLGSTIDGTDECTIAYHAVATPA